MSTVSRTPKGVSADRDTVDLVAVPYDGARRRRVQLAVFAIALLCYTTLGWAVSLFQTGRIATTEYTTASVALTPLGTTVRNLAPVLVYGVGGLILLDNFSRILRRPLPKILPALLGAIVLWLTMMMSTQAVTTGLTHVFLVATIAVVIWSIGLDTNDLVVLARIGVVIAVASLVMAVATPSLAWTDRTEDSKALFGDAVLAGFFPQMNPLGMSMAITLPFTLLFRRPWVRMTGFAAIASTLLLASSRTALIAAGIALAGGLLIRFVPHRNRIIVGFAIFVVIIISSIVVPFRSDDAAFTSRGAVWRASIELIPENPLWGYGPGVYGLEGEVSKIVAGAYWHGHNVPITFASVGGIVALIALALFLIPSMYSALASAKRSSIVPFIAIATLLALGITEAPIRPSEFDGVAWVSWATLFAISMTVLRQDGSEHSPTDAFEKQEGATP
ncbi:O-antigen ligase family protein [Microbacterium profundi]